MPLFKHQAKLVSLAQRQAKDESFPRDIVLDVVPGGGKSRCVAIHAAQLADPSRVPPNSERPFNPRPGVIDGLIWVAPRSNLVNQNIRALAAGPDGAGSHWLPAARDPKKLLRSWTSPEHAPLCAWVTSFQQLGSHEAIDELMNGWAAHLGRKPRLLIAADEVHHLAVDDQSDAITAWAFDMERLISFVDRPYFLNMTGTPFRADRRPVYGIPYQEAEWPVREVHHTTKLVKEVHRREDNYIYFPRRDGVKKNGPILKVHFNLWDGHVDASDEPLSQIPHSQSAQPLRSFVDWHVNAETTMKPIIEHALKHRKRVLPAGQMIITAKSCQDASGIYRWLKGRTDVTPALAVTKPDNNLELTADGAKAVEQFTAYNGPGTGPDVLITVAMAYEGMDAPWASHMVHLGTYRSAGWLDQCFARIWRRGAPALGKTACYAFAPADARMMAYYERMTSHVKGKDAAPFALATPSLKDVPEVTSDRMIGLIAAANGTSVEEVEEQIKANEVARESRLQAEPEQLSASKAASHGYDPAYDAYVERVMKLAPV